MAIARSGPLRSCRRSWSCGHISFPVAPARGCARATECRSPDEGGTAGRGAKRPSERSAFPPGGMSSGQVRLQRRIPPGPCRRNETHDGQPRKGAHAVAPDVQVRCGGLAFAIGVDHGLPVATSCLRRAGDAMLVFAARERKIDEQKCGGGLAKMQHTRFGCGKAPAEHPKAAQ